jgi:non-heme chloroperoxidase
MMGAASAHYRFIEVFSETDRTEDLKAIAVPTLVLHGDDDQIVPVGNSAQEAIELLSNGTTKIYPGLSHGFFATHPGMVNADLLAFARA